MGVRAGLAVAIAALVLGLQPTTSGGAGSGRCEAKHSRTVLANRQARVYAIPTSARKHAPRELHACLYATGLDSALDDGSFFLAFRPPGMALRGHLLAFGLHVGDEGDDPGHSYVEMLNLRRTEQGGRTAFKLVAASDAGPHYSARIGSLVLGAHATLAWIACPGPVLDPLPRSTSPRPGCVRAGRRDQVRTISGFNGTRVLDRGRDVEPGSLRVHGIRATWRSGGRLHAAKLPRR